MTDLNNLAKAWIEMWQYELNDPKRNQYDWVVDLEYDYVYENPNLAIDLVLEILSHELNNETKEVLAAGPLEQVLSNHGGEIIDRVETLARQDPSFSSLLGGVWQNAMSDSVWERVQKYCNKSGWDGNA